MVCVPTARQQVGPLPAAIAAQLCSTMDGEDEQDFVMVKEQDYDENGSFQPPETISAIQKWLQPTDYLADSSEYKKHLHSHVSGTGHWIEETVTYQKWLDSPSYGSIWIKAIAGAGKSVLAATIASKLYDKAPVLFFFFRQIVTTNHDPHDLTRDLISQALQYSPLLQSKMKECIDEGRSLDSISVNELWGHLVNALDLLPRVYCIIDALDEMDTDEEKFLASLAALGRRKAASIKVMMTSRPLPRIETYLKDPSILQLRLERRLVDKDISTYVDHRLDRRTDLKDEVRLAIKQSTQDKAHGSFLYARLMMDELLDHMKQMTPDIVFLERSLGSLPHSLEDLYNGMLSDHSRRSSIPQDLQLEILRCVTHSTRPLRLLELAAMLDCIKSPTLADFKDQATPQSHSTTSLTDTKAVVRKACGPLLEIFEDETISVIHHTFTEFLIESEREGRPDGVHSQFPVISPADTHHNLAVTCLRYLKCLSQWEVKTRDRSREPEFHDATRLHNLKLQYPFVDYAMTNWHVHVRKSEVLGHESHIEMQSGTQDMSLYNILDNFIGAGQHQLFSSWLDLVWPICRVSKRPGSTGNISPLHVAAWAGMTGYARRLIKGGAEVCSLDGQRMTPLSWAALKGHSEMVALLLEHDDPQHNSCYRYEVKPLHFAAQANQYTIVKQLLAAGASPLAKMGGKQGPDFEGVNARDRRSTCLSYACSAGSAESVREMMPYLPTEFLNSALCDAVRNGKTKVVKTILTSPTFSGDGDGDDDSFTWLDMPLYLAAKGRHSAIMEALLAKGADPSKAKRSPERSPLLHALVEENYFLNRQDDGWRTCFHMLLNAGADVNAVDSVGKTPLHLSVAGKTSDSHELTILLLKNGANPVARDKNGNTPLHDVHVRSDSSHIIELLISHGADMTSMRPNDGKTPLHVAVEKYDARDLQPMLKHTTDCNIVDFQGNTPLHSALAALINECATGRISNKAGMIGELIKAGADPNRRNKEGHTPLHFLDRDPSFWHSMDDSLRYSQVLNESVFPELSAVGADLEATDYDGRTILLRILGRSKGSRLAALVPVLLNWGSSIKARDHQGDSALHLLCRNGPDANLLAMLIAKGADPFAVNFSGNTLLHEIGRAGNPPAFTELLIKQGLSPSAQNNLGQTPLHLLCGTLPPAHTSWRSRMQFTLKSELASGLNMEDNNGIRPIHLAAALSGQFVAQLIAAGSDPTASTREGRTVLHVASRARQSNIVGFVLDYYTRIGRLDLVDAPDVSGRTALHEACRSGRPESVKLLLNAGASVSLQAMSSIHHQIYGSTALHFCAEFEEEKMFWYPVGRQMASKRAIDAAGILIADTNRPPLREKESQLSREGFRMFDPISESNQDTYTARVRDIVEMLLEHGADVAAMTTSGNYAIDVATDTGCEDVVEVLLPYMKEIYAKEVEGSKIYKNRLFHGRSRHRFAEEYLSLRGKHVRSILTKEIIKGEGNTRLCAELLALGKVEILKELPKLGVDFTPLPGQTGFLEILTSCGYPSLLRALGKTVKEPWADGRESVHEGKCILPFLLIACQRSLPNLDVIKILVEDFGANVNYQFQSKAKGLIGVYSYLGCPTALHKLATEGHWWQIRAMDYLLDHGATPELRNHNGETVLHVAVEKDLSSCSAFGSGGSDTLTGLEAPELLLKRGANPNAIDNNGLTCLNKAMPSIELVRMLIEYGADVTLGSKPVLFSAIELQDTRMVALLLELGADCNARQISNGKESIRRIVAHELYPVHYAACEWFNMSKHRKQAIAIIYMLLSKGASPYLTFNNGKKQGIILHDLLEHGGILQPFLENPDLDLECRDPQGRTLLLAACLSHFGTSNPGSLTSREKDMCIERDNFAERQIEERIASANELIPAHKLYELGSNLLVVDNEGNNALHLLLSKIPCENSQFDKTLTLFIQKAQSLVQQTNKSGLKPLHIAIKSKRMWPIEALMSAGADIHEPDPDGNTILHFLAQEMHSPHAKSELLPHFKHFLSLGVSINAPNSLGETPIFWYFRTVYHGLDPNNIPDDETPSRRYFYPFIDAEVDLFHRNKEGETLLHIVAKRVIPSPRYWSHEEREHLARMNASDMVDSFRLLLEKELDPSAEDAGQRTALDVAAACGNEGILGLFQSDRV